MQNNYAISYACDNNLLQNRLMRLSIDSLKKYNNLKVYILSIEKDYIYAKYFSDCCILTFPDQLIEQYFKNIKTTYRTVITNTTFCRLFIPLLLKQYDKVLYLDCDTKVQKDLSNIFNCSQHEVYGMLEDEKCNSNSYFVRSKLKVLNSLDIYVNAGVLLFNNSIILNKHKNYMHHLNYMFKIQNVFDFYNKDQDLINICFDVSNFEKQYVYSVNEKNEINENAYILHYNQLNKQDIVQQSIDELQF